jgi:hypothetical protein
MKPYANYKGNNLTEIVPRKIALVTEGANKKKFCLFKLKEKGNPTMEKTELDTIVSEVVKAIQPMLTDLTAKTEAIAKMVTPEDKDPELTDAQVKEMIAAANKEGN